MPGLSFIPSIESPILSTMKPVAGENTRTVRATDCDSASASICSSVMSQ